MNKVTAPARKYNPGFLSDEELIASFCVRTAEFDLLLDILRECTGSSNPHQIVIGPRGSGKTSLLLRVAAEVRRDTALAARCLPVIFAEESYEVATVGEFWLECLTHLAGQAPRPEDDPDLNRTVTELRAIRDDLTLADRCLAAVLDFADRRDKRLLLVVENLNALFQGVSDGEAGWRLRKALQTEPRIIVFASATSRFDEIDHPDRALYDIFQTRKLRPLDTEQCTLLWETAAGRAPATTTVRALEILTGGSPRLIAIVARFGTGLSFRQLMADLLDLVDDHTEYFKSHIESLPPQERRVYLALAVLWKPATTREIADQARLDTSTCSAQLARLGERGVVRVEGGSARRKQYYLTERLYNIYYLLRRRRGPDALVEALIRFMESYYSPSELKDIVIRIAREVGSVDAEMRPVYVAAFTLLADSPTLAAHREELLQVMAAEFTKVPDSTPARPSAGAAESAAQAARDLFEAAAALSVPKQAADMLSASEKVVRRFGKNRSPAVLEWVAKALVIRGIALNHLNRPEAALAAWDDVVTRFEGSASPAFVEIVARALVMKGGLLIETNQLQDGLVAFEQVVRRFEANERPLVIDLVAIALGDKGQVLRRLKQTDEALAVCEDVERRFSAVDSPVVIEVVAKALVNKGLAFLELDRPHDALAAWEEVEHRFGVGLPGNLHWLVATALAKRGAVLVDLNRPEEAMAVLEEAVRRFDNSESPAVQERVAMARFGIGAALEKSDRPDDALAAYDEVAKRYATSKTPKLITFVAKALVSKGALLGRLSRFDDALAACDEVLRRFGASETDAHMEHVALALVNRGAVFGNLQRFDDALAACDEVVRRIGTSQEPELIKAVALALGNKALVLDSLGRQEDALATYDEAVRRLEKSEVPALRSQANAALLDKAQMELVCQRFEAAFVTVGRLLDRCGADSLEDRLRGHLIRSIAALENGDTSVLESDVKSVLEILPALEVLPKGVVDVLMGVTIKLGPERMHTLIKESPSAALLLPLVTVLEEDLGLKPRVAQEVAAVAADIRAALARLRDSKSAAPDTQSVGGSGRSARSDK